MKPPLKLKAPTFYKRIIFGLLSVFIICFASVFVVLPVSYITRELFTGRIPWPLIGFAFLSVPFGGFMIWVGFRYRVWVLPYQFTVDFSQKACGYFWRESWVNRTDLSGLDALVTAPGYSRRKWPWVIYARFGDARDRKAILNSNSSYSSEFMAFEHSFETCSVIADYLGVPVEFDEWSSKIICQHKQGEQADVGNRRSAGD